MKSKNITILFGVLLISCAGYLYYKKLKQTDVKLEADMQKDTVIQKVQKEGLKPPKKTDARNMKDENSNESEVVEAPEYRIQKKREEETRIDKIIRDTASSNDPVYGNPASKTTVVHYYDYNCSHCKKMSNVIKKLVDNKQDIYLIFKELPILGEASAKASKAALAVNKIAPSKYLDFHFALIEDDSLDSIEQKIEKISKSLGINVEQLNKEMNSAEIKEILENNLKLASNIGIRGVPAIIVNGKLYPGAITYEQMIDAIENVKDDKLSAVPQDVVSNDVGNASAEEEQKSSNLSGNTDIQTYNNTVEKDTENEANN